MHVTQAIAANAFGIVLLVLSAKALLLGMATAARRGSLKSFINQEDAAWLEGAYVPADPEPIARIGRAHRNDLENLLLFAIVGTVLLKVDGNPAASLGYSSAFLLSRIGHTFAYLTARPLFRRNAYTLGFIVILAMIIHSAVAIAI